MKNIDIKRKEEDLVNLKQSYKEKSKTLKKLAKKINSQNKNPNVKKKGKSLSVLIIL